MYPIRLVNLPWPRLVVIAVLLCGTNTQAVAQLQPGEFHPVFAPKYQPNYEPRTDPNNPNFDANYDARKDTNHPLKDRTRTRGIAGI